jgi:hypothetical protein
MKNNNSNEIDMTKFFNKKNNPSISANELERMLNAIDVVWDLAARNVILGLPVQEVTFQTLYLIEHIVGISFSDEATSELLTCIESYLTTAIEEGWETFKL